MQPLYKVVFLLEEDSFADYVQPLQQRKIYSIDDTVDMSDVSSDSSAKMSILS